MPDEAKALILSLGLTLAVAAMTALLGRLSRRRTHVASAVATTLAFAYTVYLAEVLGGRLQIPRPILVVHLVFANLATLAYLVVVVSGVRLLRREAAERRRLHRRAIVALAVLALLATASGLYMLTRSVVIGP